MGRGLSQHTHGRGHWGHGGCLTAETYREPLTVSRALVSLCHTGRSTAHAHALCDTLGRTCMEQPGATIMTRIITAAAYAMFALGSYDQLGVQLFGSYFKWAARVIV